MKNQKRIIIVGGGISGLSAALRLKREGYEVTVLEASDRVGGKIKTSRKNGFTVECGATLLPHNYDVLLGIIGSLGLSDRLSSAGSVVGYLRNGKIYDIDSAHVYLNSIMSQLLSAGSKLKMLRVLQDNRRISPFVSYGDLSEAAAFDIESCAAYADRKLNAELKEFVVDATVRGVLGVGAEESSIVDFFFSFGRVFGSKLFYARDGLDSIPKRMAEAIGDVRLGSHVKVIEERGESSHVIWNDAEGREQSEDVDACVIAVDAKLTSQLFPQLDSWSHDFLRGLKYTSCFGLNVALSSVPPNIAASVIVVPVSEQPDLMAITLEHNKAPTNVPAGKGAVCLYGMSDWSKRHLDEPDDVVTSELLRMAQPYLGKSWGNVEFTQLNRWPSTIFSARPGDYVTQAKFIEKRKAIKRVKLAGDYFSSSCMNTAATAGTRTANEIIQMFSQ